ncbi:MAG: cytidylyltransferase domain-containing protein [Syntrophothermus sp.]
MKKDDKLKILTVIQARTSSTRFPGKIMLPMGKSNILFSMIERIRNAGLAGKIVVATTTNRDDDIIAGQCLKHKVAVFRGHPFDLLDRHYRAAEKYKADAVVRIPSDSPLIDPKIIDRVIQYYLENPQYDYVSNLHPATYPEGNPVEIMSFAALRTAWMEAARTFERENTTPYIWQNPQKFMIGNVLWETGLDYSTSHRWTLDYPEDFRFISAVFNQLDGKNKIFSLGDILELLRLKPELKTINQKYAGTFSYNEQFT